MRLFLKRSMKYLYGTILLCVLLACSVALGCIGIAAQGTVTVQMSQLEAGHTTIAVTDGISAERLALGLEKGQDFPLLNPDGSYSLWHREYNESGSIVGGYQTNERLPNSKALFIEAAEAPDVDRLAASGILAGHLTNGIGLSSAQEDLSLYDGNIDYITQAFCVLAVRCDAVTDTSHPSEQYTSPTDGNRYTSPAIYSYEAKLTVLGVPAAMEALGIQTGQQLWLEPSSDLYTAEGAPIFEKGRTYLVRGFYTGSYWVSQLGQDGTVTRTKKEIAYLPSFGFVRGEMYSYTYKLPHFDRQQCTIGEAPEYGGNGLYASYQVLPEDSIPRVTEYTGDWQDYLASEKGAVWRETVIPWVQANNNSVQMVLTEDVMTTYNFNTGAATILEGRLITDEEYAAGTDVCLVSAGLAAANGWQVGDIVSVDCYETELVARSSSGTLYDAEGNSSYQNYQGWVRTPLQMDESIGLAKSYTIVGIYTSPQQAFSLQTFPTDTVFVPKTSVPGAEAYEKPNVHYANALVLQNGTEDAFEAYMTEQGMGGYFTYCDQNYSTVHDAYSAMAATADRLAMIGICVLAIAAAVYHLLFIRRLAPSVRSARLIGVSAAKVGYQLTITLLLHTGVSVVLGTVLAFALYSTVAGRLLGELSMHTPTLFHTAAIILIALIVIGVAAAMSASRIDLMRQAKGKRKKGSAHPAAVSAQLASCTSFSLSVAAGEQQLIAQRSTSVPAFTVASVLTPGLQSMTLRGLARRRTTALMLATLALAGVLGAALLLWQIDRQQYEWELGQTNFTVHCTVTNPQGGSQQSLNMTANELYELINGPLTPHIKNVSATATEVLTAPQKYSVRRITNLSADESITRLAGATVSLLTGWDESVFATTQPVCLVPAGTAVATDDTGASYITVQDIGGTPTRLQVIGVVTGGPQNTLHIPMFLPLDGTDALPDIIVDNCGFDIADTSRLEESRAVLYGSFCDPRDITTHSAGDYGLLINDEIFQTARAGVESSIALFRLLLPLLVAGMGLIGFLATTLAAAGRRREFAVMRCMGIRRRTIAALVLEELLLCALTGTALALATALALPGAFTPAMWLATGAVLLVFVLGGVAAALRITAVDVIKLMKVEE